MTDGEFRSVPFERLDDYRRVVGYAFDPEGGPGEVDDPEDVANRSGERFGVFAADELRSVCKHYDFEARLRGTWVPLVGLAAVATPPEHRRQGYVTHLVGASLERWRGSSPLSALWPFDRDFYRRFGWATANTTVEYRCPADALGFARDSNAADGTDGRFRPVDADDWAVLQDVHETHATGRTLTLRRDEAWWREKVLHASDENRPYAYVWERDGDARGYLVYDFERTDGTGEFRLTVSDMAFADHEARLALLRYLADHDSQTTEVVHSHENQSLLDLVSDPSAVDCEVRAGPMVRLVDVEHALSSVPYPDDATLDTTLAVVDRTAPWNNDTFRLCVADGDGDCNRTDEPPTGADATLDIGTLSQLVVGYRTVGTLRARGDLESSDSVAADLATAFPETTVFLRQFF